MVSTVKPLRLSPSKMHLLRSRYMDPKVARFTEMDSFAGDTSRPLSLQKYAYANADPINVVDPSGHDGLFILSFIVLNLFLIVSVISLLELYMRIDMQGLGTWSAGSFFDYGLNLSRYEWDVGFAHTYTDAAHTYEKGCWGLVLLRLGQANIRDLYDPPNRFFTDLEDAKKLASELGTNARIFAIQFNGTHNWIPAANKQFPSEISWVGVTPHNEGNHATWHQGILSQGGFWEWLGPRGSQGGETWEQWATFARVDHRRMLDSSAQKDPPNPDAVWDWTVYGVTKTADTNPLRPPLIGDAQPTEAPKP